MALATMMANGNIIPQNLPQAKQIFTELAKQNVPNARESLASVEKIIAEKNKQAAAAPTQPAPKNSKETIARIFYHHKAISPLTPIKPIMVLIIKGLMLFHLNRRLAQKYQKRSALAAQQ